MAQLGPPQQIYRASRNGIEIRLRVNVDSCWLVIKRPGRSADYVDIEPENVDELLRQFQAIKGDGAKFDEFVRLGLFLFQNWKEQPKGVTTPKHEEEKQHEFAETKDSEIVQRKIEGSTGIQESPSQSARDLY